MSFHYTPSKSTTDVVQTTDISVLEQQQVVNTSTITDNSANISNLNTTLNNNTTSLTNATNANQTNITNNATSILQNASQLTANGIQIMANSVASLINTTFRANEYVCRRNPQDTFDVYSDEYIYFKWDGANKQLMYKTVSYTGYIDVHVFLSNTNEGTTILQNCDDCLGSTSVYRYFSDYNPNPTTGGGFGHARNPAYDLGNQFGARCEYRMISEAAPPASPTPIPFPYLYEVCVMKGGASNAIWNVKRFVPQN